MVQSINILLLSALCGGFAFGQECATADTAIQQSDRCIFECIKALYDKKHCTVCKQNETKIAVTPHMNLANLMDQAKMVKYDETTEDIVAVSCDQCSDESNPEKPFETYAEPADLVELMSCLSTIKGGSNSHINQVDCKLENEMTIGQHLMNRFNQSNSWCILFGMQSFVIPQLGSELKNNASLNATDSSKPQSEAKEPNRDLIEKIATDLPMTSSDKPKFTAVDTKTKVTSTTEPSAAQMTEIPTKTPSPNPNVTTSANGSKKNKPTDKEHHYIGSISIIVIIAGILVTVLITSAIVLRICLRKQKGDRSRSDSTIYVFDNAAV